MSSFRVPLRKSLYFKISIAFATAVLVTSLLKFYLASVEYRKVFAEVNQRVGWNTAALVANRMQPRTFTNFTPADFASLILPYAETDARLEFYLLNSDGSLFANAKGKIYPWERRNVSLEPITRALSFITPPLPILGDDPIDPTNEYGLQLFGTNGRIFSVAPLRFNGQDGYLYIIIEGHSFRTILRHTAQYFLTKMVTLGWLATFLGALLVGFLLFRNLTRRFREIAEVAEEYRNGNYEREIKLQSSDELGVLSRTLNEMAQELIEAKKGIENQDTLRRNFIAHITHDLRSPLQVSLTNLEYLKNNESIEEDSVLREKVELMLDSVHFQNRLLNELWELSALEAKESLPSFDSVSLNSLFDLLVKKFSLAAERSNITLAQQQSGDVAHVVADKVMLTRALTNLLENAMRFTPPGGSIQLRARYATTTATLEIQDNGPGLSPEQQERARNAFSQIDVEENRNHSGAGLGLAIVNRIAELHGSTLEIENVDGGGSVFRFTLPLED